MVESQSRVDAVLERLPRILGGYGAACVAASLAVALVMGLSQRHPDFGLLLGIIGLGMGLTAAFAFIPAAALITIAEAFGLRGAGFYGVAGVIAAMVANLTFSQRLLVSDLALLQHLLVSDLLQLGPGGLVGGLVYWGIAGRSAGARRNANANDVTPQL